MHDAGLDNSLGKHGGDRFRKALQPIHDGNQDVANAPVLELVHHPEPELRASGGQLNPYPAAAK
jgi:Ran GTPase-activating protein (RanGAP) involved in mRNA processing and transport